MTNNLKELQDDVFPEKLKPGTLFTVYSNLTVHSDIDGRYIRNVSPNEILFYIGRKYSHSEHSPQGKKENIYMEYFLLGSKKYYYEWTDFGRPDVFDPHCDMFLPWDKSFL